MCAVRDSAGGASEMRKVRESMKLIALIHPSPANRDDAGSCVTGTPCRRGQRKRIEGAHRDTYESTVTE